MLHFEQAASGAAISAHNLLCSASHQQNSACAAVCKEDIFITVFSPTNCSRHHTTESFVRTRPTGHGQGTAHDTDGHSRGPPKIVRRRHASRMVASPHKLALSVSLHREHIGDYSTGTAAVPKFPVVKGVTSRYSAQGCHSAAALFLRTKSSRGPLEAVPWQQ